MNALRQSVNKKQFKQMNELEVNEEIKRLQDLKLIPAELDEEHMKV